MRNCKFPVCCFIFFLVSCNESNNHANKPIVLGDTTTIVTETDPQYLQDFVGDIKLIKPVPQEPVRDTILKDTGIAATTVADHTSPVNVPGLTIAFKEVKINIPGITGKSYRQQDPASVNGVTYELTEGTLTNNQLIVSGGNVQKVSMRYQTSVVLKSGGVSLLVPSLNTTTSWSPVKGNSNSFKITGLEQKNLEYAKASPSAIAIAVKKAARNKHLSRNMEQRLLNSTRRSKSVNQQPFSVVLRSVMWKIEGKDMNGKTFVKQIRIDIPQ